MALTVNTIRTVMATTYIAAGSSSHPHRGTIVLNFIRSPPLLEPVIAAMIWGSVDVVMVPEGGDGELHPVLDIEPCSPSRSGYGNPTTSTGSHVGVPSPT
jgi:hypothetical protein